MLINKITEVSTWQFANLEWELNRKIFKLLIKMAIRFKATRIKISWKNLSFWKRILK